MTCGDSMEGSGVALKPELTLFEYGTCPDKDQAAMLYEHRQYLQPYLEQGEAG